MIRRMVSVVLIAAGMFGISIYFTAASTTNGALIHAPAALPGVITPSREPGTSDPIYPRDRLFITRDRMDYTDGELVLRIPALDLESAVIDGVEPEALKRGTGLYPYAQLPGSGNRNTSIAGHRDVQGKEFYRLDELGEGDLFFLDYQGKTYVYIYEATQIVEPDDWGPIYCRDEPSLTLTTCHPIGIASERMIITARLTEIKPIRRAV